MEFLELTKARYSVRKFADKPVEAEKLNIPTDVEWLYGVTADPGKTLGDVNSGGDAA